MADQVLQDIKDRLDVVEVVGSYIPLKKSGTNFKAVCPFHNESTPSFMVSPQKQIWHCFGCGEGGDIFGFLMRYENIEFREALSILADKAGVILSQFNKEVSGSEPDIKGELIRINNFAAKFYHKLLKSPAGKDALSYVQQRGLSEKTIDQWQIGFAPDEFHTLEQALAKKEVKIDLLLQAGVSAKNERGQIYDRFRNRVTFPIFNYYGDAVGFSARLLGEDKKQAKYVNSPETVIYNKSKVLFGLNFAKEAIRQKDEVVVVEGQMDCIQAHQAGFANVVATSGTALTEQQLVILGRITKNLKFCFDADAAGGTAARRAGELALHKGFRLKLIQLQNAKDPDELIRKSPKLWEKAVREAVWFVDYYINHGQLSFPAGSVEQKHYLSESVIPLLQFIVDPIEQDHYVRELSSKFAISESVIRSQLKSKTSGSSVVAPLAIPSAGKANMAMEKQVLGGMLLVPEFMELVKEQGIGSEITDPNLRQMAQSLLDNSKSVMAVKQDTLAKEATFMVESELDNLNNNELALLRELKKSLLLLKLNEIKRTQQELTLEIKKAETINDSSKIEELNKKFAQLVTYRARIESELQ